MTIIDGIILGIIQGVTEFLPISSSGHLVLAQEFLGIDQPGNKFEILVHMGTLASILVIFFGDIKSILFSIRKNQTQKFIYFIIIGTIPAVLFGLSLKDTIDSLFDNTYVVGIALVFTGIILYASKFFEPVEKSLSYRISFLIGIAQALAIIPGISRSGITISCALFLGLNTKESTRFSFLLAIPVIFGAGLLMLFDIDNGLKINAPVALGGLLSSFIVGFLSLKWLLGIVQSGKFHYFGVYCFCIGFLTILYKWI
tara:strand:- start:111 stop:878 length:768 start_codon:yes stop_codon:yes gene_type:complete